MCAKASSEGRRLLVFLQGTVLDTKNVGVKKMLSAIVDLHCSVRDR